MSVFVVMRTTWCGSDSSAGAYPPGVARQSILDLARADPASGADVVWTCFDARGRGSGRRLLRPGAGTAAVVCPVRRVVTGLSSTCPRRRRVAARRGGALDCLRAGRQLGRAAAVGEYANEVVERACRDADRGNDDDPDYRDLSSSSSYSRTVIRGSVLVPDAHGFRRGSGKFFRAAHAAAHVAMSFTPRPSPGHRLRALDHAPAPALLQRIRQAGAVHVRVQSASRRPQHRVLAARNGDSALKVARYRPGKSS